MSDPREDFQARVEVLVRCFESGVDQTEWVTRRYPKRFQDEARQVFEIPALYLQKGPTKLLLDPIGYDIPGAEGLADIYLMPGYDPLASIYFEGGHWRIHYTFPPDPPASHPELELESLPLDGESINRVLDSIVEYALP